MDDIKVLIDGEYVSLHDTFDEHVKGLLGYTIGGTKLDQQTFHGRWRTNFSVLQSVPGERNIQFTLAFEGEAHCVVYDYKTAVDALMVGVVDILMPNGFYYRCYSSSIGDLVVSGADDTGLVVGTAVYKLSGICHDPVITEEITPSMAGIYMFGAGGSMPRMDCKLEVTVGAARAEYKLGTVTFTNVSAGDVLTADGINGQLLVNGAPAVNQVTFTEFPYLVPGDNAIDMPPVTDPLTITYEPIYI